MDKTELQELMEVYDTSIEDISEWRFEQYFTKEFGISYQEKGLTYEQALRAKRVLRNGRVTLAGLLFFGKNIQSIKPAFTVKLVSYFGNDLADNNYRDKPKNLQGTIPELFEQSLTWVKIHLKTSHTLPYSGLGSGIKRALKEQPDIILENDIQGEQFRVVIPRIVLDN